MKRIVLNYLMLLMMALCAMPVMAYNFEVDGIYYNILGAEVEVTCKYSSGESYSGELLIPETVFYEGISYKVTAIGEKAFYYCSQLNSISLPNTICKIGDFSFYSCKNLTSIIIPDSVESIGWSAFDYCESLNSILIPKSVLSIETTFSGCDNLSSIVVDNDNPVYDSRNGCNAIIETASNTLISGCKNTTIPNSISTIGRGAFANCRDLSNIIIPNSVTKIDDLAFWCDHNLTSITIPNSVDSIGSGAFGGCGLKCISIPSSVVSISITAFTYCGDLARIIVEGGNSFYDSRNNCNAIIETSSNTLLRGCRNTVIPNSVVKIGEWAFDNSDVSNILIPPSVTTIGMDAFLNCGQLRSMTISNSVTSIDPDAFSGSSGLTTIYIYGSGEWLAGSLPKNSKIKELYIGSDITSISGMRVNPTNIYCFGLTPPVCNDGSFTAYSGKLHVPAASLASYFTASYWCDFPYITGDAIIPEAIKINTDTLELFIGEQYNLVATMIPNQSYSYGISWTTSNPDIAIVNNGQISAVCEGECDLFASCFDLVSSCHLIVRSTTISIYLDKQDVQILPNHIVTLTPSSSSSALPDLSVSSSAPTIANARIMNGEVQIVGIKEGTATITVGSVDGTAIPATCFVTVYTEPGDVNCDGYVNISDVTKLIDYLLSGIPEGLSVDNADVNKDGGVNISDVTALIGFLLSGKWPWEPEEPAGPTTETFSVNGVSFTMVAVEGGTFMMGKEGQTTPVHQVTLSDFLMGETEVTQALWVAVMGTNPSYFKGNLQRPVEYVSWNTCQSFISKLNNLTGMEFRMPTEAEWEYAARGGNKSKDYEYAGSNTIDDVAWYGSNSNNETHPVATKMANELGLYDMSGNVQEWCHDWQSSYPSEPQTNPTGPESGSGRVSRGGNYNSSPTYCRTSQRYSACAPWGVAREWGLRLALSK